jgi:hypothetical protein
VEEWDLINPPPQEFSLMSNRRVWWKCKKCHRRWRTAVSARTGRGTGCPVCCASCGYSRAQITWLEEISKKEGIHIKHAKNGGEQKLPIGAKGKMIGVDGFCEETQTVYQYHGDFYHGNPAIFNPNDINPKLKMTYGELYRNTKIMEQRIRNLGHPLVVKWETEEFCED